MLSWLQMRTRLLRWASATKFLAPATNVLAMTQSTSKWIGAFYRSSTPLRFFWSPTKSRHQANRQRRYIYELVHFEHLAHFSTIILRKFEWFNLVDVIYYGYKLKKKKLCIEWIGFSMDLTKTFRLTTQSVSIRTSNNIGLCQTNYLCFILYILFAKLL